MAPAKNKKKMAHSQAAAKKKGKSAPPKSSPAKPEGWALAEWKDKPSAADLKELEEHEGKFELFEPGARFYKREKQCEAMDKLVEKYNLKVRKMMFNFANLVVVKFKLMKHRGEESRLCKFNYLYKKYKPFCGYFNDKGWGLNNNEGKFISEFWAATNTYFHNLQRHSSRKS